MTIAEEIKTAMKVELDTVYAAGYEKGVENAPIPDGYIVPSGELEVTENGIYDVTEHSSVNVNVSASSGEVVTSIEDGLIDGTLTGEYVNDRLTSMRQYAFYQQYSIKSVRMNRLTSVSVYGFGHCTSLEYAEFSSVTSIAAAAFIMCYRLKALVLQNSSKVSLLNANALSNCYHFSGTSNSTYNPNGDKDGYIYVPDDLVEQYKADAVWSTYASQIKPLSELSSST